MIRVNLRYIVSFYSIVLAALLLIPGQSIAANRIVIATWGGVWSDSLKTNVLDPFAAKNNVEFVIFRQASTEGMTKVIAEKGAPTIDILFCTPGAARNVAKAGAAMPLIEKELPQLANIPEVLHGKYEGQVMWVSSGAERTGVTIRKDLVKIPEKVTVDWLTDPGLKGKLGVPPPTWNFGTLLSQLSFAAGPKVDVDKGFDVMKRLAPNVRVVYGTTGEAVRLMTSGEIAVIYSGVAAPTALRKNGVEVEFRPFNDLPLFVIPESMVAVKNAPAGKELVLKFLDYLLSPEVIAAYNAGTGASSVNVKSAPISLDRVPFPTTAAELPKAHITDITINIDQVQERWKRDIVPLIGK